MIKIVISGNFQITDEDKETAITYYENLIEQIQEKGLWDPSIKSVIITDNLEDEIAKQAKEWNITNSISKEKEYIVVSKCLYNQDSHHPVNYLYISFQSLLIKIPTRRIFIEQVLRVFARKIVPLEIQKADLMNNPITLDDYVQSALTEWITTLYANKLANSFNLEPYLPFYHDSFLIAFKRKLKKSLFDYNSDIFDDSRRLRIFWINYFLSIRTLILRIIETDYENQLIRIDKKDPSSALIYNIVKELEILMQNLKEKKNINTIPLKEAIKLFSAQYDVFVENEEDDQFMIRLTKNPKDYFKDEIVETEPRFVCFIDILGFSTLINEYDSNITSTILQDIQESFKQANTYLFSTFSQNQNELTKYFSYQTFSDNICISIPYFDNETDFVTNLHLLITYVRALQLILMVKGFFTRGGISIGSYYSDNNIIFSKGLVNAYLLESKKAIYPRVLIDKPIIDKLYSYDPYALKFIGIDKAIIFDWENCAFLNPFGLIENTLRPLTSLIKEFNSSTKDPSDNILDSINQSIGDLTSSLLSLSSESEKNSLEEVKILVNENIDKFQNDENIRSKYIWLKEFIKWIESDESGKLKFQTLADHFNYS